MTQQLHTKWYSYMHKTSTLLRYLIAGLNYFYRTEGFNKLKESSNIKINSVVTTVFKCVSFLISFRLNI